MDVNVYIGKLNIEEAESIIREGDTSFVPYLSQIIDIPQMAAKWAQYAKFILLKEGDKLAGTVAFYENNVDSFIYISHFVVLKTFRHIGLGHLALDSLIKYVGDSYRCIRLEVRKNNFEAGGFYFKEGFEVVEEKERSYMLEKKLNELL